MILPLAAALAAACTVWVFAALLDAARDADRRRALERAGSLEARRGRHRAPAPLDPGGELLRADTVAQARWLRGLLSRFRWTARRAALLDEAGLPLRVSDYVALLLVAAILLGAAVVLLSGIWPAGVLTALLTIAGIELALRRRAGQRWERFNEQLPVALQMMASSLQSGFGILEAIRTVARETESPLRDEFQTVLDEILAGAEYETSLERLAQRVGGTDMRLVAQALSIHRTVGGDLGEILAQVAATSREREGLRRHIHSLTSQERLSAIIMGTLPIWVFLLFVFMAPELAEPLWTEPIGRVLAGIGAALEVTGFLLMRRMMRVEV